MTYSQRSKPEEKCHLLGTSISFDLPRKSEYSFQVINVLGQTILEKTDVAGPGRVDLEWSGDGYASGMYFYRLTVGDHSETRKMMSTSR